MGDEFTVVSSNYHSRYIVVCILPSYVLCMRYYVCSIVLATIVHIVLLAADYIVRPY